MNFKLMSIDKLSKLKDQIEAALASKVTETRRALESQLAKLTGFRTGSPRGRRGGARGKVAPKYRNPSNPAETWAGRGLRPRWLTAALKGGKKLEHFAIAALGKKAPKKTRNTKRRAVRKVRMKKVGRPRATMRPASSPSPASAE